MKAPCPIFRASELGSAPEYLVTPLGEIPRGTLTEIAGPASSGRTSFLCSLLAAASAQEYCVLVDAGDTFDPSSASEAGVELSRLLWVRCGDHVEHALKATDWLAQLGGFGVVVVDLAEAPESAMRRIPLAAWFRLRRAVEDTRTALVAIGQRFHASTCSSLKIELMMDRAVWRGRAPGRLLEGIAITAAYTKNHRRQSARFEILR